MHLTTTTSPYRASAYSGLKAYQRHSTRSSAVGQGQPADVVTLSATAGKPKHNGKMMAILGSVGTALGIGASLLIPGVGLGGILVGALVGGVTGTAIGDGALTDAGTRPSKPFDPYSSSDILDPDNLFHPLNPFNPLNWPDKK